MGVVGTIIGMLGMSFLEGQAQKRAYEAQAQQARQNAEILAKNAATMEKNAENARKNAEETARNSALNTELQRRKARQAVAHQNALIGKSGLSRTGSLANALNDSYENVDTETAMELFNGRQAVTKIEGQSTDFVNQANQYHFSSRLEKRNANAYEEAGQRAFMTSILTGALKAGMAYGIGSIGSGASSSSATSVSGNTWNASNGTWALDSAHMTIGTPSVNQWWQKGLYKGGRL